MAFMLKVRWEISKGEEDTFRSNQEKLCKVMLEHPGIICYHADYPSANVSDWTEIYATDEAFAGHLEDEGGQQPLNALVRACESISCHCWGEPNENTRDILKNFGATYEESGKNSFVLNPSADKQSRE